MLFGVVLLTQLVSYALLVCTTCNGDAFDQQLPDCRKQYDHIEKKTSKTALTYTMIRNEEGFLAEWLAFYQMHGFVHIILFDHNSTDDYREEIRPWVDSGFASVYTDWKPILGYDPKKMKTFWEKMVSNT